MGSFTVHGVTATPQPRDEALAAFRQAAVERAAAVLRAAGYFENIPQGQPLTLPSLQVPSELYLDEIESNPGAAGRKAGEELAKLILSLGAPAAPGASTSLEQLVGAAVEQDARLRSFPLSKSTSAQRSAEGKTAGVYFCEVDGQIVVVKPPGRGHDTARELAGTVFARVLGIHAPAVAMVPIDFQEVTTLANEDTQRLYDDICAADAVLVMERVEGTNLGRLSPKEAHEIFLGKEGPSVLRQIGRIAVFDALIGNEDRLPLADVEGGNEGNLMFTRDGKVYAIDNVAFFTPRFELLARIQADPRGSGIPGNIRHFIQRITGVDIGDEGEGWVADGMRDMCRKLARFEQARIDEILALCTTGRDTFPGERGMKQFQGALEDFKSGGPG